MTGPRLRVAVTTTGSMAPWQSHCIDTLEAVPGVSVIRLGQRSEAAATGPGAASEPAAAGEPVDVILELAPNGTAWPRVQAAETWRFGFGTDLARNADDASLRTYVRGRTVMRVALVREPDGSILREGLIEPGPWWHREQLHRVLVSTAGWVAAEAAARLEGHEPGVAGADTAGVTAASTGRGAEALPRPALLALAAARRVVGAGRGLTTHDDWHLGLVDAPIERFLSPDPPEIAWVPGRPGHFAADPFGVERDGVLHVLYEDFDQRLGRGSIHHLRIERDGTPSETSVVLDTGLHASYPFLVEDQGTVFMLPEIAASGSLVLYEATAFPFEWRPVATLLPDIPALDASVVRFEDRWWLFACRLDRGINHDLFLWHAPDLLGPWTPHASNPVKTDARSARPGGTPFVMDGVLYRPSQDDSRVYGGRLVINRVTELSTTRFREEAARVVRPNAVYPDGLHTLSAVGARTLVDGNVRHLVPGAFRREARRHWRAMRRRARGQ